MNQQETAKLLSECDAGIQMAISSLDDVLPMVESKQLRHQLQSSLKNHNRLSQQTQKLLTQYDAGGKSPNPMAVGMSWLKTNVKLAVQPGDQSVADLMIDGCNMGVKALHRYQNRYPEADQKAKDLVEQLILEERSLSNDLEGYL
ncbi:MAG: hypothetical protein R3Y62_03870 [Eubacteriales bacterium]